MRNYHLRTKLSILEPYIRGKDVLDIGCIGDEHNYRTDDWLHGRIVSLASHAIGIDVKRAGIAELLFRGYEVYYADAQKFSLEHTRFDVIFAGELLEHLDNPRGFMESVLKCLKPTGVLIITTPNPFSVQRWLSLYLRDSTAIGDHVCWYDKSTLANLLARFGLYIDKFMLIPVVTWRSFWSDCMRIKTWHNRLGVLASLAIEMFLPQKIGRRDMMAICRKR